MLPSTLRRYQTWSRISFSEIYPKKVLNPQKLILPFYAASNHDLAGEGGDSPLTPSLTPVVPTEIGTNRYNSLISLESYCCLLQTCLIIIKDVL